MNNSVLVHYHSHQGNYFNMSLWQWQDGKLGKDAFFSRFDSFGAVALLDYEAPYFLSHVFLIIKEQYWKKQSIDYK
ncbi:hypothetical protein MX111_11350, partial [Streptococcus uberis]